MTQQPEQSKDTERSSLPCLIRSHAVLEIRGDDASKFLQGQCSADIEALGIGQSVPGAICTVKGRVISSFFAHKTDQNILLVMQVGLVSITHNYLKKYAAFFKVELIPWTHTCIVFNPDARTEIPHASCKIQMGQTEIKLGLVDEQHSGLIIEQLDTKIHQMSGEADWAEQLLKNGWVVLNPQTTEKYLPHPLNLDLLQAVNFNKGCYTGQEIIARTEYRGKPKRRVQLISFSGLEQHLNIDLPIDIYLPDNERPFGELINLNARQHLGLALLPLDIESEGNFLILGSKVSYKLVKLPFSFD